MCVCVYGYVFVVDDGFVHFLLQNNNYDSLKQLDSEGVSPKSVNRNGIVQPEMKMHFMVSNSYYFNYSI